MGACQADEGPAPSEEEKKTAKPLPLRLQPIFDELWAKFDKDNSGFLEMAECKKAVVHFNGAVLQSTKDEFATKQKQAESLTTDAEKEKWAADQELYMAMISGIEEDNKKYEDEADGSKFIERADGDADGKVPQLRDGQLSSVSLYRVCWQVSKQELCAYISERGNWGALKAKDQGWANAPTSSAFAKGEK